MHLFEDGGCLGLEEIQSYYHFCLVFFEQCWVARRQSSNLKDEKMQMTNDLYKLFSYNI